MCFLFPEWTRRTVGSERANVECETSTCVHDIQQVLCKTFSQWKRISFWEWKNSLCAKRSLNASHQCFDNSLFLLATRTALIFLTHNLRERRNSASLLRWDFSTSSREVDVRNGEKFFNWVLPCSPNEVGEVESWLIGRWLLPFQVVNWWPPECSPISRSNRIEPLSPRLFWLNREQGTPM